MSNERTTELAGVDLETLVPSTGRVPPPLIGCSYDVSARVWVPPGQVSCLPKMRQMMMLPGYEYQVEKARLASSVCKRCGEKIDKGKPRIGFPTERTSKSRLGIDTSKVLKKRKAGDGAPVVWLHVSCARFQSALVEYVRIGGKLLRRRLLGYDALEKPDQVRLRADLLEEEDCEDGSILVAPPAVEPPKKLLAHPAPSGLRPDVVLLPVQAEGLRWMLAQEADRETRGGILADEMGMGKTLQAIATILANPSAESTLIVCPATCILQWESEIKRFSEPGAIDLEMYYGTDRKEIGLRRCRIVLTTYETLSSEYRHELHRYKARCMQCGEFFFPERLKEHEQRCQGIRKRRRQNSRAADCLSDDDVRMLKRLLAWAEGHAEFRNGRWRGSGADTDSDEDANMESAIESASRDGNKNGDRVVMGNIDLSGSPLLSPVWSRVILDEAHRIKSLGSMAKAVLALKVNGARWCLSGTPIHNRIGELHALISFLRFFPYAYSVCNHRGCECTTLTHHFDPRTSSCSACGHARQSHRSCFNTQIQNPVQRCGFQRAGKVAMEKLRTEILGRLMLRRLKRDGIDLPPLTIEKAINKLDSAERDFYDALLEKSRTELNTYVKKGTVLQNYAHIFALITKLRQAADDPYLITHGGSSKKNKCHTCVSCQNAIEDDLTFLIIAKCGCAFHDECFSEQVKESPLMPRTNSALCPGCSSSLEEAAEEVTRLKIQSTPASQPALFERIAASGTKPRLSTKIKAALTKIEHVLGQDPANKVLVFAQFLGFIDLLEHALNTKDIRSVKASGSMNLRSRHQALETFEKDASVNVFLLTLKVGAEGLNLQAANHVFLMDPWWNPALEQQAIQRAHRLGQSRPVLATRFLAADTIEERILELQEKKQCVFDCTIGGSNQSMQRLTAQDVEFLFS